jgi:hypothetical protein
MSPPTRGLETSAAGGAMEVLRRLRRAIPYVPAFNYLNLPDRQQDFRSISLLAMSQLSASKGCRLIGAHRHGFNVFFVRDDLAR